MTQSNAHAEIIKNLTDMEKSLQEELASAQAHDAPSTPGACFAAVVRAPHEILEGPGARAAAIIHGICDEEIAASAEFPIVWERFLAFVEGVANSYVDDSSASEEEWTDMEVSGLPRMPERPPTIVAATHNGYAGACIR